jgi:hypothetical protein
MSPTSFLAKFLRFLGILFMGLTAGFTLLGGIGTTCVALNPTGFSESMASLAPYQGLYILFVLAGVALGVLGIYATVLLIRGAEKSYRYAMIALVAGTLIGIIHMVVSRMLRGKSMPVDAVVYTTLLTLILFLILRIPYIWQGVDFTRGGTRSNLPAAGAAAIAVGLLALSIQFTMGPTHTWNNINYANAFNTMMTLIGCACLLLGSGLLLAILAGKTSKQPALVGVVS